MIKKKKKMQVSVLSLLVNFQFLNSLFFITALGQDLFSGTYVNNFTVLWWPVTDCSSKEVVRGSNRLGLFVA